MKTEKLTILAIDDQQDNLITLKAILTDALPNAVLLTALDGPQGLAGEQILMHARVIAIADAYDAMTSYRTYGTALSENDAIEEIKKCSGFQFDPEIARVFVEKVLKKPWE